MRARDRLRTDLELVAFASVALAALWGAVTALGFLVFQLRP